MQNRRRAVLALLIGVALVPSVAGCSGNPIENLIHNATGGNVDLGGASVPKGFPSAVPLYDGQVLYGIAVGGSGSKAFNVTMRVPEGAGTQIQTQLEDAGFTLVGGSNPTAEGGAAYDGVDWGVLVVLTKDKDGWIANYTVTPKDASSSTSSTSSGS